MRMKMKAAGSADEESDTDSDNSADAWINESECSAVVWFTNKSWHYAKFCWVLQHP